MSDVRQIWSVPITSAGPLHERTFLKTRALAVKSSGGILGDGPLDNGDIEGNLRIGDRGRSRNRSDDGSKESGEEGQEKSEGKHDEW